jgi:hypothetical protein
MVRDVEGSIYPKPLHPRSQRPIALPLGQEAREGLKRDVEADRPGMLHGLIFDDVADLGHRLDRIRIAKGELSPGLRPNPGEQGFPLWGIAGHDRTVEIL